LICRGTELKTSIGRQGKQAGQVIEVCPFASKVCLFGKTMPRKTTKQGMSFLKDKLADILPGLRPYLDMFDHDLCDAAVAAYTALLYHRSRVEALGNSEGGLIIVLD
jgi:predicted nuclease with RNAse H fold